jgi:hypothetical protein
VKTLKLYCHSCGSRRAFAAANADAMLRQIDDAGWEDQLWREEAKEFPRGHAPGECPNCIDARTGD